MQTTTVDVELTHRSPTTDAMHYGTRFDCTLSACIGDVECVSPEPTTPRELVVDGWDGMSQPVYCYRDELHLPRYARHGVDYRTVVGDKRYDAQVAARRGINAPSIPFGSSEQ